MPNITTQRLAMGIGTSCAMVDVTAYINGPEPIVYSWGRGDQFRDISPTTFSFVLDNYDGRFTPGNASSPLATTVTEGMAVSWQLGTRVVLGGILSIEFAADETNWGRVTITCDDMLGIAARTTLGTLPDALTAAATQFALWRMDDAASALVAVEANGGALGPLASPSGVTFGAAAISGLPGTQAKITAAGSSYTYMSSQGAGVTAFSYPATSLGFWGFWVTPIASTMVELDVNLSVIGYPFAVGFDNTYYNGFYMLGGVGSAVVYNLPTIASTYAPHYLAMGITTAYAAGAWTFNMTMYLDGVAVATTTAAPGNTVSTLTTAQRQPYSVAVVVGDVNGRVAAATNGVVSRVSHTLTLSREDLALSSTEAGRLVAIGATVAALTLGTPDANLSTATTGFADTTGTTAFDALNAIAKTEQGYLYTATSGTLLTPAQTVNLRSRVRSATVAASFDAALELSNVPQFLRDLTNMVATETVTGPSGFALVTDSTITGRVASSNASETVLNSATSDLAGWGQDRLNRGKNVQLRVASIRVDAMTTPTDRSAALLALLPGDRVRLTNLPSASLGFTSWEGWLIGTNETHDHGQHIFELMLAPVLPATGFFDTDRFDAGSSLSLAAALTASATTVTIATTDATLEIVVVPYSLTIDSEQVTVTACTSATPQVATITRGANGTTAAAHTTAAILEVFPLSLYAF